MPAVAIVQAEKIRQQAPRGVGDGRSVHLPASRRDRGQRGSRCLGEQRASGAVKAEFAAKEQKGRAEEREQLAIDAVKRFRDAVVESPELKNTPSLGPLRKTLLREPLAFFKTLRDQLQRDRETRPDSLARLAAASFELGRLAFEIGDQQDARGPSRNRWRSRSDWHAKAHLSTSSRSTSPGTTTISP